VTYIKWIIIGTAVAAISAAPRSASADDAPRQSEAVSQAEAYAGAAYSEYERENYVGAVALYQKALELTPSADIFYNLARIFDTKLNDRKRAIEYYRRYTLDTGAEPERLRLANERLRELEELEQVVTEAIPATREPVAVQKEPATAKPVASAEPVPQPVTQPESAPVQGLSGLRKAGIVIGSLGLAGLGVGAGFGLAAKSAADEASDLCDGNACRTQHGVDVSEDALRSATIATIALSAGGGLAALGLTFVLAGRSSGDDSRDSAKAWVAPVVASGGGGAALAGRW
jgi:tetratricopeptide (TPR) repeat protein